MEALLKKLKIIEKLKGKLNYPTWKTAIMMNLRANQVANAITQDPPVNPADLTDAELVEKIKEWLAENNEIPETGFSAAKVNGNKAVYKKSAEKEYNDFIKMNDIALELIYSSCESKCQMLIKDELNAKKAWNILKTKYSETGFAAIFSSWHSLRGLTLRDCDNELDVYTNKIKKTKSTLESHNVIIPDDIWSAIYLEGLDDSFQLFIRELLSMGLKSSSFDDVVQTAFNEKLAIEATYKKEHQQANIYKARRSKNKDKSDKFCDYCERPGHDEDDCFKKDPGKTPEWFKDMKKKKTSNANTVGFDEALIQQIKAALQKDDNDNAMAHATTTQAQGYVM
jgi:hypothetical protein